MSTFRFLPATVHLGPMGLAMAQEAFMKWTRIEMNWRRFKDKIVFRSFRSSGDSQRSDPIGAKVSGVGQGDQSQPAAFHPDDQGRRSEFSLHIGC